MHCPKCADTEMTHEAVAEIEIDRCPACHGIWLDAGELEKLIAAHPRRLLQEDQQFELQPDQNRPQLQCPRCQGAHLIKLNSRLRPGTIIDSCTVCFGNWLDAGELTRLAGRDLAGRLRKLFGG